MNNSTLSPSSYSRTTPYLSQIKERQLLNSPHSTKQTYHISLHIQEPQLHFLPGDSIGIFPQNDPLIVSHLLSLLKTNPEELIIDPKSGESTTALAYLCSKVNLARINSSLLRCLSTKNPSQTTLSSLVLPENKELLSQFLQDKDLIDLFLAVPLLETPSLQELCEHLSPLLPRFYSISSSRLAHPDEVHILVALASHMHRDSLHYGVAGHFLCNLAIENNTPIPLYVQPSQHFRLPSDTSRNVIMVGPGTGVAPFRAFLQERIEQGGEGKNWLFFGGRQKAHDFFYEDYWNSLVQKDKLKISTAFSRDQQEKEYVQHKLLQEAKEIWQWLQEGALFYLCGDATYMAKDVEGSLLQIFQETGALSLEEAKAFLKELKKQKRYLTDIY